MRILGIDPGEKNVGIAISDPTGTLARPLTVITHSSRRLDAENIIAVAEKEKAGKIVIGQATDIDGKPNFSGRKAARLAAEIRSNTSIPVELWDESFSTRQALEGKIKAGASRKNRQGHLDDDAAAVILQSYLDMNPSSQTNETNPPKIS
ncbi:MAG: Holliday junction resolvase RuvX [Gammaproteobacteria bacterium]|nr:Holliday junction resolvase RuvX [Gammaproteobacteria bacterium]